MKLCRLVPTAAKAARELRRTSRTFRADARAGFTLIEMMAVLVIIALIAGLTASYLPGTGKSRLKAITLDTADLLRRERIGAVLSGQKRMVYFDAGDRRLIGQSGRMVEIPRDVALDVLSSDAAGADSRTLVRFDADGASTGAALKLSREGVAYEVQVSWYTGAVKIIAP